MRHLRATNLSAIALAFAAVASASAADFAILPPGEIALHYPGASHSLIVQEREGDRWIADRTGEAKFVSSDPAVATVDEDGVVRAVADGAAAIRVEVAGATVETRVVVDGTTKPFGWSFPLHIQPVLFKTGCNTGACHGAAAGKNGFRLSLRGFDHDADLAALTRQAAGRRVSLAEPEQSLILLKAISEVRHGGGERFEKDSEEYRRVLEWIRAGAPGARPDELSVERLEIFPKLATLGEGKEQRFLVRAIYTDGTYEDVTRYAAFGASDDTVAKVDEDGVATVIGSGGSAITAWYSSKVTFAELVAPREKPVADEVFASAERRNFVDALVLARLKDLRIPPAPPAGDADFLRRAYLDATGTLPPTDVAARFALDPSPDKRDRLVDALLASEAFVDYWTYKWSDLLLLSSTNLPNGRELRAFHGFVRDSVAKNRPWDEFVRDIVAAKGNSLENGAVNYFVMHNETIDLTETTSKAFLGMSLTCARCHNHPLEKWTQDDYYGFANLFSRVKLKNSTPNGGTFVLPDDFSNIAHPRLGRPVDPKPLDADAIPLAASGDRREFLAQWLTSPENPYFTRAIVNRVWKNFMGRGLVEEVDDLRLTNPASNEELMAALAAFLVEKDYDLKELMRAIMNSATYRRASESADPDAPPDGKYYSQYIVRRLPAEVILDAYAQATGVPTDFPGYPNGYRALQLPDSKAASYFLDAFGRPERNQTCACERSDATSVAQTLHVANGETLNQKLRNENSAVSALVDAEPAKAVEELYMRTLARRPGDAEREAAVAVVASVPAEGETWRQERREAIEDVAWSLMSSKEFLFNH